MLRKSFLRIFLFSVIVIMFSGCFSSDENKSVNPWRVSVTPLESDYFFDNMIAQNSDYLYFGTYLDEGMSIFAYKKEDNKTLTKTTSFITKDGYASSLAADGDYIVVGNSYASKSDDSIYEGYTELFKMEDNGSVKSIATFTPNDDVDSWDGFGNLVSISNNYILVGTDDDNAYLFKINSDENITQIKKLTMPEEMISDDGSRFASSLLVKDDKIAISGYSYSRTNFTMTNFISVYRIGEDGNVTLIDTIGRADRSMYFGMYLGMEDDYLVTNIPSRNTLYTYKIFDSNVTELSSLDVPMYHLQNSSLALEQNYIVQAADDDDDNLSLDVFKLEDNGTMNLVRELPTGMPTDNYFSYVSFYKNDIFTINTNSLGLATSISWYDLRADDKIYTYINPDSQIDLGEGDSFAYNFYLGSPKGPLSYTIEGDDKEFFKMKGDTLENVEPFDYENPLDASGDNNYSITIKVEDQIGNQKQFDMVISVYNKEYIKTSSAYVDSGLSDEGFATSDGYIYTGLWNHPKLSIFKDSDGYLEKLVNLGTDEEDTRALFGFSVASYGKYFATSAIFADDGDGRIYLYKMDNDTPTLITDITPAQSDTQTKSTIDIFDNLLAITYNDRVDYHEGWISLYSFNDNGANKLGDYLFKSPSDSSTDIPKQINISENYLTVIGEQNNMYINKIEQDDNLTLIDTLPDYYIMSLYENSIIAAKDTNLVLMSIDDNDNVNIVSNYEINDTVSSVDFKGNYISVAYKNGGAEVLTVVGDTISKVGELNKQSNLVRIISNDTLITGTKSDDRIDLYERDRD